METIERKIALTDSISITIRTKNEIDIAQANYESNIISKITKIIDSASTEIGEIKGTTVKYTPSKNTAWTEDQMNLIRKHAKGKKIANIDIDKLAKEIMAIKYLRFSDFLVKLWR